MKKKWSIGDFEILKNNLHNKNLTELSKILNRSESSIIGKMRINNLKLNVYKNKYKVNNYDWVKIQKYYDNDKTWRDVANKFNITDFIITRAKDSGLFKTRTRSNANKLSHKINPRIISEETKKKISISRIKYLKENPSQVPYLLNHYSKGPSYPEIYFDKIFKNNNLKYEKFLQISIYQLDFAFIENGINIEIDGEQHYSDKRIVKSNIRKDKFLKEMGWDVIRIRWSDYQKMLKKEKKEYIKKLVEHIRNKKNEIPTMINNRIYCIDCGKEISRKSKRCKMCYLESIKSIDKNVNKKIKQRKVINRPSIEQILIDVKELGYCGTGRKYGVSDNSIRKWLK